MSRLWQNKHYKKITEFRRINLKTTSTFQRFIWEKWLFSSSPGRYISLQSSRNQPKNKVEIEKISLIFVSFLFFLCSLHRQRIQRIIRDREESNGVWYLNPKLTTINQKKPNNPNKITVHHEAYSDTLPEIWETQWRSNSLIIVLKPGSFTTTLGKVLMLLETAQKKKIIRLLILSWNMGQSIRIELFYNSPQA